MIFRIYQQLLDSVLFLG